MQQHLRKSREIPGGCLEKLFLYMEPVREVVQFDIPPALRDIRRLPAHQAIAPCTFEGPTRAEIEHQRQLEEWKKEWRDRGLPETIEDELWHQATSSLNEHK